MLWAERHTLRVYIETDWSWRVDLLWHLVIYLLRFGELLTGNNKVIIYSTMSYWWTILLRRLDQEALKLVYLYNHNLCEGAKFRFVCWLRSLSREISNSVRLKNWHNMHTRGAWSHWLKILFISFNIYSLKP